MYPLVIGYIAIEMAIEIVDLPLNNGDFPIVMFVLFVYV